MVETAKYDVALKEGEYEIRQYPKMLVATATGTAGQFNRLFQYISGRNKSKSKIAMTSPVITSEKIAMTAPVLSRGDKMSFAMPSDYDADTVPEPTDPTVLIEEIPERHVATIRFRGLAWRNEVRQRTESLLDWLSQKGLEVRGEPFLMQYNPPFVPGFLRRNEVGVEIDYSENNKAERKGKE
jgi:effector-binding domain-containing protein